MQSRGFARGDIDRFTHVFAKAVGIKLLLSSSGALDRLDAIHVFSLVMHSARCRWCIVSRFKARNWFPC